MVVITPELVVVREGHSAAPIWETPSGARWGTSDSLHYYILALWRGGEGPFVHSNGDSSYEGFSGVIFRRETRDSGRKNKATIGFTCIES